MSEEYRDPVAQLLTLGDPHPPDFAEPAWRDYLALGLTAEHVSDLARMALDEELYFADIAETRTWAPLHAWRALGQLRSEAAVEPLLKLLDLTDTQEDDWVAMDLPQAFGMIGSAAIPGLCDCLVDPNRGVEARSVAMESLVVIAQQYPESREQAITILTAQLRRFAEQGRGMNAFLVNALCDLKAVEAAAEIEQAFAAGAVDLSVLGDWEEAQIILGLLEERVTPAPNFFEMEWGPLLPASLWGGGRVASRSKASRQKKAKRKQVKASRRRARRR